MAYSIAAKRDPFNKKQCLCISIIPQNLCQVLAESAFKRPKYNVFESNTPTTILSYEYIHGHVSPATLLKPEKKIFGTSTGFEP